MRGTLLNHKGDQTWIAFKYERLPNFCFNCGISNHPVSGCPKPSRDNKIHDSDRNQYGIWLRTTTNKSGPNIESTNYGKKNMSGSSSFEERVGNDKKNLVPEDHDQTGNLNNSKGLCTFLEC